MALTWKALAEEISKMPAEQQNTTVTVYVKGTDEFYGVVDDYLLCAAVGTINDVIDEDHPYLVI